MSLESVQDQIQQFAADRDWQQFHTIRNLILAIQAEVGELAEVVQWVSDATMDEEWLKEDRHRIAEKWADVFIYLLRLAQVAGFDAETAALEKIAINGQKYPISACKGNARKYSELGG